MIRATQAPPDGRTNRALTEAECLCLLAEEWVGRVVYVDGVLPTAFPVNYLLMNRSIVFRTKSDARLLTADPELAVSFEIDRFDEQERTGWSVLVTGRCRPLHPGLADTSLDTWASLRRGVLRGISCDIVSGRRLEA